MLRFPKISGSCIKAEQSYILGSICGGENNGICICGQCGCVPPSRKGYKRWGKSRVTSVH